MKKFGWRCKMLGQMVAEEINLVRKLKGSQLSVGGRDYTDKH